MNISLLLVSLMIGSYKLEDFHYYDDSLQAKGLNLVSKIYVSIKTPEERNLFIKSIEKLKGLNEFYNIKTGDLNGVILNFNSRETTLKNLNILANKGLRAYPVILFNNVESTLQDEIYVNVHPSVSVKDFLERVNSVFNGDFVISESQPKSFILKARKLYNPSNAIILANLIAKDSVWVKSAGVIWLPLDGGIKATATVETLSSTHLGQTRNLKITIDIIDPEISLRKDMLPVLGQGFMPFPNIGELWLDCSQPSIVETVNGRKKTVTVNHNFRQLVFGNFLFHPIIISYEKNGVLSTIRTELCRYDIKSVIEGTEISDIQARTGDGLDLVILKPSEPYWENDEKGFYYLKMFSGILLIVAGILFVCGAVVSAGKRISNWWLDIDNLKVNGLWIDLEECLKVCKCDKYWRADYNYITHKLNRVLIGVFGVSLYNLNLNKCNTNFCNLVKELQKVYMPPEAKVEIDSVNLIICLKQFCKERKHD